MNANQLLTNYINPKYHISSTLSMFSKLQKCFASISDCPGALVGKSCQDSEGLESYLGYFHIHIIFQLVYFVKFCHQLISNISKQQLFVGQPLKILDITTMMVKNEKLGKMLISQFLDISIDLRLKSKRTTFNWCTSHSRKTDFCQSRLSASYIEFLQGDASAKQDCTV